MKPGAYLLVSAKGHSPILFSKRVALREGRRANATVLRMDASYYREAGSWDYPTFRMCATCIANFRKETE